MVEALCGGGDVLQSAEGSRYAPYTEENLTSPDALDRLWVAPFESHHDGFRGHVALAGRRQRPVQPNLELVNLVEDAEVLEVLRVAIRSVIRART